MKQFTWFRKVYQNKKSKFIIQMHKTCYKRKTKKEKQTVLMWQNAHIYYISV